MNNKQRYTTLLALLIGLNCSWAAALPNPEAPVVPPDSVINSLYHSFTARLDSAQKQAQQGEYREAARLYAASFAALQQFGEQRREYDSRYLAAHYETEQKEQRIAFLHDTLPLKRRLNLLLILLCVASIVTMVLLFTLQKYRLRSIRQRAVHRENETRLMELEKQQHELETRLQRMEMEKCRKELMAESLLVDHKSKVLDDLRGFFSRNPALNSYRAELEALFYPSAAPDEPTGFNTAVDEIHPVFYDKLQERASNRLTPLDLEYCRMIVMKMSSKEMAGILQVGPNTIRMGKYRLKQKLGLGKDDDLNDFIEKMAAM